MYSFARNECNSNSGGNKILGFGNNWGDCTGSLADTTTGPDTIIKRFSSTTFGTLPVDSSSLKEWSSLVENMKKSETLLPLPMKQELRPLSELIDTYAARNIRRADGSFINTTKVAISAAKGYLNYLDLVEPAAISYQMACATTIKLDNVLYVQQNVVMNGRRIYRDESEIDGNYLMYDYADYTWRITPDYHSEEATLFNTSTVTLF